MGIKKVVRFKCGDGEEFDVENDAIDHETERVLRSQLRDVLDEYVNETQGNVHERWINDVIEFLVDEEKRVFECFQNSHRYCITLLNEKLKCQA